MTTFLSYTLRTLLGHLSLFFCYDSHDFPFIFPVLIFLPISFPLSIPFLTFPPFVAPNCFARSFTTCRPSSFVLLLFVLVVAGGRGAVAAQGVRRRRRAHVYQTIQTFMRPASSFCTVWLSCSYHWEIWVHGGKSNTRLLGTPAVRDAQLAYGSVRLGRSAAGVGKGRPMTAPASKFSIVPKLCVVIRCWSRVYLVLCFVNVGGSIT
jgi:hypothetical protein